MQNWLRRIGGSFRDHACLQGDGGEKPVALYMPVGQQMVLQPSETAAAQHVMLPQGSGLWKVVDPGERLLWGGVFGERPGGDPPPGEEGGGDPYRDAGEALFALMNSPHPLDILADVAAYGPQGMVSQYHNPFNYARALANEVRRRNEWRKSLEKGAGAAVMRAASVARVVRSVCGGDPYCCVSFCWRPLFDSTSFAHGAAPSALSKTGAVQGPEERALCAPRGDLCGHPGAPWGRPEGAPERTDGLWLKG